MNPKDKVGAKKAPLDLLPMSALIAMSEAMGNGAEKYGPFNWREQPVQVRTYVGAALRHLAAFLDGQWAAEDTGISHLAHAMAGIGILYDAFSVGSVEDNRVTGAAEHELRRLDKSVNPGGLTLLQGGVIGRGDEGWEDIDDWSASPTTIGSKAWAEAQVSNYLDRYVPVKRPFVGYGGTGDRYTRSPHENAVYAGWFEAPSEDMCGCEACIEYRGEWPPDTRVNGLLTCCGQSEHPLDCPQYRD